MHSMSLTFPTSLDKDNTVQHVALCLLTEGYETKLNRSERLLDV